LVFNPPRICLAPTAGFVSMRPLCRLMLLPLAGACTCSCDFFNVCLVAQEDGTSDGE